jgi:site-specific recombinase
MSETESGKIIIDLDRRRIEIGRGDEWAALAIVQEVNQHERKMKLIEEERERRNSLASVWTNVLCGFIPPLIFALLVVIGGRMTIGTMTTPAQQFQQQEQSR